MTPSTREEAAVVDNHIVTFNNKQVAFTQKTNPFVSQNYVIKNDANEIIAGVNALIYCWGILYIDVLFVDENHRGNGLGKTLLQKVEAQAKAMGAALVHLDSFDFQNKDFYVRQGYVVFGTLEDCPSGHTRFYLKKSL